MKMNVASPLLLNQGANACHPKTIAYFAKQKIYPAHFLNRKTKILLNWFLAPALSIVLIYSLYRQIIQQPDLEQRWIQIKSAWHQPVFWVVLLLMLVNWGIEALKWKVLISHLEKSSFTKCFKAVLSGCSITMLTPNRIGEYGGRILFVKNENRIKAVSLTIVGSISQLLITFIMGSLGLFILRFFSQAGGNVSGILPHFWGDVLLYMSMAISAVLLLFYLRIGWLVRMMEKINALNKVVQHIKVLDEFDARQLLQVMFLSFIRYLVFVMQFLLLLRLMQVDIVPWQCFWLISVFYLVMAVAPTIGFLELPVRAKAGIQIFGFAGNTIGIGAASLGIWFINLVLPAVIGSLLILGVKIFKEK